MPKIILSLSAIAARLLPNWAKQAIYRSKPLAGMIRRKLNQAAPTGLSEVKVAGGDLAGYTILLDMQVDKDYWLGTYEPELQSILPRLIPKGGVVYDVGANIGYVSLLLARAAGEAGKVFAFEALPGNVRQIRRNLELNGMGGRITIVPEAVTQAPGAVKFLVHASGGMGKAVGSAGREDIYQEEIEVRGVSLDDFVFGQGNPAPQVVKMDIEGGEVMALPGMRRVLAECRPVMLIELHGPESARVAWETLTQAGYTIHWMKKGFPRILSPDEMDWKAYIVARPA